MMKLDNENFELQKTQRETFFKMDEENLSRQKRDYLANYALQTQTINAQREHQKIMLDLQKQSAGIQAAAAAEQIQYAKDMDKINTDYTNNVGVVKEMLENTPTETLRALSQFGIDFSKLSANKIEALDNALAGLATINTTGLSTSVSWIQKLVSSLSTINTAKISALIRLISYID